MGPPKNNCIFTLSLLDKCIVCIYVLAKFKIYFKPTEKIYPKKLPPNSPHHESTAKVPQFQPKPAKELRLHLTQPKNPNSKLSVIAELWL